MGTISNRTVNKGRRDTNLHLYNNVRVGVCGAINIKNHSFPIFFNRKLLLIPEIDINDFFFSGKDGVEEFYHYLFMFLGTEYELEGIIGKEIHVSCHIIVYLFFCKDKQ